MVPQNERTVMKTKQVVNGLKNSQKIRVILNGIGFFSTVYGVADMPFSGQRSAVWTALMQMAKEGGTGYGSRITCYDSNMKQSSYDVQVNLV